MTNTLPKLGSTNTQERRSVNAIAAAAARMGQIWRETLLTDVGIDGQLEFVDADGYVTGRLVAIQVKSGPSYLASETETAFKYYIDPKHRTYWERFPIPVILVLHDPSAPKSYWTDVRQFLRNPANSDTTSVPVPKSQVFEDVLATELFRNSGVTGEAFISDIANVFHAMLSRRSHDAGFALSFFDLFARGLTSICRCIYFGVDLAIAAAEENMHDDDEFGVTLGDCEHKFLFDYAKFLISQNLADIDFGDCLIDWVDRELQPHFVAPLTSRGRELVRYIGLVESELVKSGALQADGYRRVAQEAFFKLDTISYLGRIDRIALFQRLANESRGIT